MFRILSNESPNSYHGMAARQLGTGLPRPGHRHENRVGRKMIFSEEVSEILLATRDA
jgi:hypothetical protein